MIIGFNKLVLDVAHDRKSSRKMWSLIRAANELMWGPVHFYIFDLAFKQSDHRKEVYTAMVKNGKDIIAQKEEGRERERQRKKNTFRNEFCLNRPRVLFPDSWVSRGGRSGPSFPSTREEILGVDISHLPYYPLPHTHIPKADVREGILATQPLKRNRRPPLLLSLVGHVLSHTGLQAKI